MALPFEIDSESLSAARDITSALRYASEEEPEVEERYYAWGTEATSVLDRPGKAQKPGKARAIFQEVAQKVAKDVDMSDVAENVAAHDELQRAAAISQISLPLLKIDNPGGQEIKLPCLFAQKEVRRILAPDKQQPDLEGVEKRMKLLVQECFSPEQIGFAAREDISKLFFDGLNSFLAVRIAGSRWLRADPSSQLWKSAGPNPSFSRGGGGGGGGGGTGGGGGGSPGGNGQWWEAHTNGSGLVLYWANRFGAQTPPTSLGGKTTPLKVFILSGDGFVGADAGPNHTVRWDPALVQVPSHNPVFKTNQF